MSTEHLADLFGTATVLNERNPWLGSLIMDYMSNVASIVPQDNGTDCPVTASGNFLVKATLALSKLAGKIAHGPYIDTYTDQKLQELEDENDLSDLSLLHILNDKHTSLKLFHDFKTSLAVTNVNLGTLPPLYKKLLEKVRFRGATTLNRNLNPNISKSQA